MSQVYERDTSAPPASVYEEEGAGWVLFAGIMIGIVGVMNVIYGISAIDNSSFWAEGARYIVFNDLNTWGWILLAVGAVQCCAAVGIFARSAWARWVGILSASVNAMVQLLFLPSFPLAALALFSIDILVIYG